MSHIFDGRRRRWGKEFAFQQKHCKLENSMWHYTVQQYSKPFQQPEDRILTNTDTVQARQQATHNSYHSGLWSVMAYGVLENSKTFVYIFSIELIPGNLNQPTQSLTDPWGPHPARSSNKLSLKQS